MWVTSKRYLYKPIVHFKCLYVYKGITSCPRHQEGYKGNIYARTVNHGDEVGVNPPIDTSNNISPSTKGSGQVNHPYLK